MPILATNIPKARHPMEPVEATLIIEGEERTETLRLNRSTISPQTRSQFQEIFDKTAPDKEEIIRLLVMADVQSPDIVDAESRPYPLTAEYMDGLDDSLLLSMYDSLQTSRRPKVKTSDSTKSG